jgi:hypothetical protein
MATKLIPNIPDTAYSRQRTRLDGRDYVLEFAYNEREDRWYLTILDDEETPLVCGLKLVTNFPLLRRYKANPDVPPGELMAIDLTGNRAPPSFAELGEGRRVELTYFEAATLQEISP